MSENVILQYSQDLMVIYKICEHTWSYENLKFIMKYGIKFVTAKNLGNSQICGSIVDLMPKKIVNLNFLENIKFCIFLTRFHKYTFFISIEKLKSAKKKALNHHHVQLQKPSISQVQFCKLVLKILYKGLYPVHQIPAR